MAGESPAEEILIADCGQLSERDSGIVASEFEDGHEDYPSDDDSDVNDAQVVYGIANEVKEKGTELFKKGNFGEAQKKYIKALRCKLSHSFFSSQYRAHTRLLYRPRSTSIHGSPQPIPLRSIRHPPPLSPPQFFPLRFEIFFPPQILRCPNRNPTIHSSSFPRR